jgi:putative DNA primase/helicase
MIDGDWPDPSDEDAPDAPPVVKRHVELAPALHTKERPSGVVVNIATAWQRGLARDAKEKVTKDVGNIALVLARDEDWKGIIRHDAFSDRIIIGACPPLPRLPVGYPAPIDPPPPGELTAEHDIYIGLWLRRKHMVTWGESAVRAGAVCAAKQNSFNPATDYLDACADKWDRKARLNDWLVDHLGAERSVYSCAVASMWLISAVARAYEPGAKVDHVLILEGLTGIGKTTALEILFGNDWFLPELPDLRDKDAMHALAGCMCALVDEMTALRSAASVERAKSFFTRRIDVYRPPYGRDVVRRQRTCVFAATTNLDAYLTDETGNRRYWPVRCAKNVDQQKLRDVRDQLWGEAVARYRQGEQWHPTQDLAPVFREEQEARYVADDWETQLTPYVLRGEHPTTKECLLALGLEPKDWSKDHQMRVGRCLRRLGFERRRVRLQGLQNWRWFKIEP